jgi:UDP-N-acetylmuramoyl-tripeptide--D-alanyl-D-alanine ligase
MLELGDRSVALHEGIGSAAARAKVDALIAIGGVPAAAMADAAIRGGLPRASVRHYSTSEEAADAAAALVTDGDLVLVKGSRGVRTDRVVDRLKTERS